MFAQQNHSQLDLSEEERSPNKSSSYRQEWDQPISKLETKHSSTLSALNVPRTDFLKALNFERFSARSHLLVDEKPKPNVINHVMTVEADTQACFSSSAEESEVSEDVEEDEAVDRNNEEGFVVVNGEVDDYENERSEGEVNDSDAENCAPEELDQAQLLAKFKELRDLQFQEQQQMMLEQQVQLEMLRAEQQKVQDMIIQHGIAALSPQRKPANSRNTSMNESALKLKLINSPRKCEEVNTLSPKRICVDEYDINHNITATSLKRKFEDIMTSSQEDLMTSPRQSPEMTSDEEEVEEVDEDYLQCSMVETEAEAHVHHVEDLLRNSRDLFALKDETNHVEEDQFEESDFDTPLARRPLHNSGDARFQDTAKTPAQEDANLDEKPISTTKKTFEELLEEKLKLEEKTPTSAPSSGGPKKRPFLRRGQGTARFGSTPPVPRPKPGPKTTKSPVKKITNEVVLKAQKPTVFATTKKSPIKQTVLPKKIQNDMKRESMGSPVSVKQTRLDDVELEDLEEFEMLEKYADDDYSFTSNCSIIKARPAKMKKYVVGFGDVHEEKEDFEQEGEPDRESPLPSISQEPPSSTPRRLRRKIASKIGPPTTVEKDVLVEDFSPSVQNGDVGNESEGENFDDEDTWAASIPKPNFTRQNHGNKAEKADEPPTSKLVSRLFPSLKPQPKVEEKPKQQAVVSEGVMSKALKDKLGELEAEIEKFRQENAVLAKIKKERLEGLEALKKEVEEFEKKKAAELNEIEEMRENEMKKLRNEKKMFEKYQKEMRAIPDKNQRREIEDMKAEVAEVRDEMRQKETRWSASTNRLRNRIENLEKENQELQEEIKLLEKQRLDLWQKEINSKEKKKKTQTVPPQMKKVHDHADGSSPSEALRQQFDKLLRASLDDFDLNGNSNEREEAHKKMPLKQKQQQQPKVRQLQQQHQQRKPIMNGHIESQLHHEEASKPPREPVKQTNGATTLKPKPIPKSNIAKPEIKIDVGDGNYREIRHKDGKIERTFSTGAKEILFANGSRKQVSPDGQSVIVSFFNGDIKQTLPDQRVVYYYADSKTKHTTYPDGIEILEFPNQQIEKHYPTGTREIVFPDQTIKYLYPSGAEESVFSDGTTVKVDKNGDRVLDFPNGQKEIHTKDYKRREYPDGTTKTVYPDGRQETRYASGRVRIKDSEGKVLVDKMA